MILQKFRTILTRTPLGLTLAVVFLFSSCSRSHVANSSSISQLKLSNSDLTGENYFKAVFFIDGPLSVALEDYQEFSINRLAPNAETLKKTRDFQNKVIDYIRSGDAAFFDHFKTSITSGNYSVVKSTINSSAKRYLSALSALTGKSLTDVHPASLINDFSKKYGDTRSLSKAQIAKDIKEFAVQTAQTKTTDQVGVTPGDTDPGLVASANTVYYQNYFWVYIAAAAAIAAILFVFLDQLPPPTDPTLPP
ncbi:MAG: hypothetical protein ABUL46_02265, partial [Chitinophaga rupis]